jgi:hypothetical protein
MKGEHKANIITFAFFVLPDLLACWGAVNKTQGNTDETQEHHASRLWISPFHAFPCTILCRITPSVNLLRAQNNSGWPE